MYLILYSFTSYAVGLQDVSTAMRYLVMHESQNHLPHNHMVSFNIMFTYTSC